MDGIEVVVAHGERTTLRVGDVFLKVDVDPARGEAEVAAMALAPVPTPTVLWRQPLVLALAAVPGVAIGHLGEPSRASSSAWAAAGAAVRRLHDAPLPTWPARNGAADRARLDAECRWLVESGTLDAALVARNRAVADGALRAVAPVFVHGDLQADHVFVDGDVVTGVIDWSEAGPGDPATDIAALTIGHAEHLPDVLAGYGPHDDVDVDVVRAWWSLRSLLGIRWLVEHGFDPSAPGCEVDVLRARM